MTTNHTNHDQFNPEQLNIALDILRNGDALNKDTLRDAGVAVGNGRLNQLIAHTRTVYAAEHANTSPDSTAAVPRPCKYEIKMQAFVRNVLAEQRRDLRADYDQRVVDTQRHANAAVDQANSERDGLAEQVTQLESRVSSLTTELATQLAAVARLETVLRVADTTHVALEAFARQSANAKSAVDDLLARFSALEAKLAQPTPARAKPRKASGTKL